MSWQISSEVANAVVLDTAGRSHRLGDSWISRPAVLVFIRHFG
jgi:hypothetical protein